MPTPRTMCRAKGQRSPFCSRRRTRAFSRKSSWMPRGLFICWHGQEPGKKGENNRQVWVAVSTDDGKTFAAERAASADPTGACGCCGLRAFADSKGTIYTLYRGAKTVGQRDMYLLTSLDK